VSKHPVHVTDQAGVMSPSSLIPFCSFGTDLLQLGNYTGNFTFPTCTSFRPTVEQNKLCYILDGSRLQAGGQGEGKGLLLIIDTNKERSIEIPEDREAETRKIKVEFLNMGSVPLDVRSLARIHVGTLSRFTGLGPGNYHMGVLKEMTGTDSFLAWPESKKQCSNEGFEECQERKLVEKEKSCGCRLFGLGSVVSRDQVLTGIIQEVTQDIPRRSV
jgi:hypothetical protein